MSSVPDFDVARLAGLARLELSTEERQRFSQQLPAILAYVSQLQTLDLDGIEETAQVTGLENVLRDDVYSSDVTDATRRVCRDALLAAVPAVEGNMVKVPAILTEGE